MSTTYHDDLMSRISAAKSCRDLQGCLSATDSYSKILSSLSEQITYLAPLAIPPVTPAGALVWVVKMTEQYARQISNATSQIEQVTTQQAAAAAAIAAKMAEIGC